MNLSVLIIICFLLGCTKSIIKAGVKITKYDPLSLQLAFSQAIPLPEFQLLIDSISLPYIVLNNDTISSVYQIQATINYQLIDTDNTQFFSLVFNYPLEVANGRLSISSYVLSPQKADLFIEMSTWPVYLMFALLSVCSAFSIISLAVIDFIQIYILTEMKFQNKTSLIETYRTLFFFDHAEYETDPKTYIMKLIRPTIVLIGFFLLGIIAKFIGKFIKNTLIRKRIIKAIAYDIFISAWMIFLPSVIYKAFQFISDIVTRTLYLNNTQYIIAIICTYLNFVNILTYFYVLYFVINPKIGEDHQSFTNYVRSPQFQFYCKFHRGLHLSKFVKRNTVFFMCLRKLIVVILFFVVTNISPYVLCLQMIGCFFIFTIRPYKEWQYTNIFIGFNLVWFFYYIMVLEGFLYFDISQILLTRSSLSKFLLSKSVIFHVISFFGFVASAAQCYRLFNNLKYEFMEDRTSKVKKSPVVMNRPRLYTETSDKMDAMKESLIFDSPNSPQRRKKRQPSGSQQKGKISLFQIEMQEFSPAITSRKLSTRIKKKWKDKSLLQQLASNPN